MRRIIPLLVLLFASGTVFANTCTIRQAGATDQTVYVEFIDSTTGVPNSGLAFNSSGIDLEYVRAGAAAVDITEATQTAAGAHSDGGFVSVGHGRYRLDLPDAAVAAGVPEVVVQGVITGYIMLPCAVALSPAVNTVALAGTAQTANDIGQDINDILTDTGTTLDDLVDDLETRLGTPANLGGGATVAGNLSDIETQTDDIGAAGAGLTVLATQASVNTIDDFVDTEVAAILADTGTDGVVIAETTGNCREVLGCDTQGTLSGTHSSTTADLGANAPANDISGMTLVIPSRNFSRAISSYNTGTGVATWDSATGVTLANSDQYYLHATAPSSGGGGGLDAAGVRAAIGLASANLDTQLTAIDNFVDTEVADILTDTGTTLDDLVDDLETRLGTPSNLGGGATVAANLSDIEGQTDDIGAAGAGLTVLATQASVNTVDDFLDTELAALITTVGVAGAGLTATDDAIMTRVGAPVGASISADIAAVESGISWNSAWDTEVQSEANDALVANLLDQLLLNTYNPATPPGATDSLLEDLIENDAGVTRFSSNSLEQAPTGSGASAETIAQEVAVTLFDYNTGTTEASAIAGSVVYEIVQNAGGGGGGLDAAGVRAAIGLSSANLDTQLSTIDNFVDTEIADILTDTGTTLQGELDGIQADTEDLQTRVPAALVSGRIDASVGAMVANTMTAAAAAPDLTTELQSGLATASALTTVSGYVDDIGTAGAGLTAVPWNASWDAEVQSEATDALNALTLTEPAAVPTWGSSTLAQWVAWIGAWSRNEVQQSSTTKTLRNDADSANISTCAVSDDGSTFQVSECQ